MPKEPSWSIPRQARSPRASAACLKEPMMSADVWDRTGGGLSRISTPGTSKLIVSPPYISGWPVAVRGRSASFPELCTPLRSSWGDDEFLVEAMNMSLADQALQEPSVVRTIDTHRGSLKAPVSVIVPVKNEAENLRRCLPALAWADEVFVIDSQSSDETAQVAAEYKAHVVQFYYNGMYPKKKNWALNNLPFHNEWVLIIDADEV